MPRATKRSKSAPHAKKSDHVMKANARCELDTRAGTIRAGMNFHLLSTTGGVCNVKGFHDDFDVIKDILIARVTTAFQDEHEAVYILIINKALYLGLSIDHSLINPN